MKKFNIDKYVNDKIEDLQKTDKTFRSIYDLTFRDEDFVMFETTDGNRIKKITYGQCKKEIEKMSISLNKMLSGVEKGKMVGIYAQNSIEWIQVFWAIMKCGYRPLLMNTRMNIDRLNETLSFYNVGAIISDGQIFDGVCINIKDIEKSAEGEDVNVWANELIVMSSGTSLKAKLCEYDGESFYYQLLDSANIIQKCKPIKQHYNGHLKQLMFLPLYHIFGLSAMFMWFAFFSRTFVVLKDQNPETILFTIRKHKVTHIFAVPLFWEVVYKKFLSVLKQRDEKTIKHFAKGMKIIRKTKSAWLAKKLFKEAREKIFGESIQFLITGGSSISPEILAFFNSIGYHMANGYGMSEVGITSVELSSKFNNLTDCAVGCPFSHVEYKVDDEGELLVRGKSTAKRIYIDGQVQEIYGKWYNTLDIAEEKDGRYFIRGRKDDMIVGVDGECLNPAWIESQIVLEGCEGYAIVKKDQIPTLIIQVGKFVSKETLSKLKKFAKAELVRLGVVGTVHNIAFTYQPLINADEFKLNRRRIASLLVVDEENKLEDNNENNEIKNKLREIFAKSLDKKVEEINDNAHYFFDLKGNSLDYFACLSHIQAEFGVANPQTEGHTPYSINEFYEFIIKFL